MNGELNFIGCNEWDWAETVTVSVLYWAETVKIFNNNGCSIIISWRNKKIDLN